MKLSKGQVVMITKNRVTGRVSHSRVPWLVLAVNETHVKMRYCNPSDMLRDPYFNRHPVKIFQIDEYDFSLAHHFL